MSKSVQDAAQGAFKVNSLSNLETADPVAGKVVWDAPRSIWNTVIFMGAIILAPIHFNASALFMFLILTSITLCAGHSVGFHRRLIHKSFDCPKWLERVLVYIGTIVGMGGPIWTIKLHDSRDWAQRQPDCHSFLRHEHSFLKDGLLYLHGKLVLENPPKFDAGKGISDDRFYNFLDRTWMLQQLPIAGILYITGGMPWLVWGVFVRVAACTTMHWAISYFAHTRGPSDWEVDGAVIQAHNVPLLAIPTMGESWHGNHHAFPSSAKHGLYPEQIDLGWYFICLLSWVGLAKNVKTPKDLPARKNIRPMSDRAMSIVSQAQFTELKNRQRP
ncbi:acyl-CoA desaturase [Hirschia maritima]|uniref:acyl-CoA desaturase n=1 Tax=Hirschia maritima TaxID=1121961 RepID=UPI00036E1BF0|nr:acyl-CoA desaturase [Hirschia maritima]